MYKSLCTDFLNRNSRVNGNSRNLHFSGKLSAFPQPPANADADDNAADGSANGAIGCAHGADGAAHTVNGSVDV
jgi:hypothetical protein